MNGIRASILTVSDRCSRGEARDTSGPALTRMVEQELDGTVISTACVQDVREQIAQRLRNWATGEDAPDLILTTGGTGLAPRDVTPEATLDVIERRHSGLTELIRLRCFEKTPLAFLSRAEAGTVERTLIINLPGSERGATESLAAILDVLPHAIKVLSGDAAHDSERRSDS
ncbi:MAG: MogA/MoaB family molybdenum cofactor biosynthesis protein [Phycisphaerales bacterium]